MRSRVLRAGQVNDGAFDLELWQQAGAELIERERLRSEGMA